MAREGAAGISRARKAVFALVVSVASFCVVFAIAELAVRALVLGGPLAALRSFIGASSGPSSTPWFIADPELGYKLNPAKDGVNSLGIVHDEIAVRPSDDRFRVLVIGDSVAFGRDSFVDRLRDGLADVGPRGAEVINASVPGYTTYQERVLLVRDLLPLEPDLVLLQYCTNDNHRFLHQLDERGHWIITPEAIRALLPGPERGRLARWLRSSYLLERVRLSLLARMTGQSGSRNPFPWNETSELGAAWRDDTWPEQEEHLRAMQEATRRAGGRLAVVAVPYEPQLEDVALELDRAYTLKPQRKLAEISERLDLVYLDLHAAFARERDLGLFSDRIHLSQVGRELAAREILELLRRESLLPGENLKKLEQQR